MTEMIRSFIAIPLTENIREHIIRFYEENQILKSREVRTVKPESIHITLKFLGDVTPATLEKVRKLLETITLTTSSFSIRFRGLGAFPGWRNPRVIWIGMDAPDRMAVLAQSIEEGVDKLGFQPEARGFNPHLTIARVNQRPGASPPDLSSLKNGPQPDLGDMVIRDVALIRSDLRPSGPIYTRISTHPLSGNEV